MDVKITVIEITDGMTAEIDATKGTMTAETGVMTDTMTADRTLAVGSRHMNIMKTLFRASEES